MCFKYYQGVIPGTLESNCRGHFECNHNVPSCQGFAIWHSLMFVAPQIGTLDLGLLGYLGHLRDTSNRLDSAVANDLACYHTNSLQPITARPDYSSMRSLRHW